MRSHTRLQTVRESTGCFTLLPLSPLLPVPGPEPLPELDDPTNVPNALASADVWDPSTCSLPPQETAATITALNSSTHK